MYRLRPAITVTATENEALLALKTAVRGVESPQPLTEGIVCRQSPEGHTQQSIVTHSSTAPPPKIWFRHTIMLPSGDQDG